MGTLAIPALALSAGASVFGSGPEKARVAGPLLDAPPPVVLVALGLLMVGGAVARRYRKNAAQRMAAHPRG
jgi:MYXO-CTERM domain-containing protein